MLRSSPSQLLGITHGYYTPQRFRFITLTDSSMSSLAYRAGIKNYDRVIAYNGLNIEADSVDQFPDRFNRDRHLPVQMLLCSPATYEHYKAHQHRIHIGLETVQYLQPVTGGVGKIHDFSNFYRQKKLITCR